MLGCSGMKAKPADTSPFLEYPELLKPWYDRAPWDAVWSAQPGKIMVQLNEARTLYIAPINTHYLNLKKDKDGKEIKIYKLSSEDRHAMTNYLQQAFVDAIKNTPKTNLTLVSDPSDAQLILEIALVELVPTSVGTNAFADIGALIIPGASLAEEAAAAGGQAAGTAWAAGTMAMEFKIIDRATRTVIAEAKDRESDPASIIPNYRDFEEFGWSRKTAQNWAEQFAEIFSSPANEKIELASEISYTPW